MVNNIWIWSKSLPCLLNLAAIIFISRLYLCVLTSNSFKIILFIRSSVKCRVRQWPFDLCLHLFQKVLSLHEYITNFLVCEVAIKYMRCIFFFKFKSLRRSKSKQRNIKQNKKLNKTKKTTRSFHKCFEFYLEKFTKFSRFWKIFIFSLTCWKKSY